ncbi:FadR/GntR family transcriptional regulator [Falsiroseomonas sp.]|uniref:FadR/GntR family transcriptional regulator n=1 Tax=Falsiroseomonas sp. TaxID=2870721 RepID=UPI002715D3F8|nr:FadR/GntR family transcriptional regulator [Falsiroseomonas sp.]MDO9502690.1 FadR/GntR family transcriptional regulator [Falsiroseomonas sp.]
MPFQPLEPRRLFRRIAEQIAAMIAAGELPPGSRLPSERDLAPRLNVSRPSLREALIALEIEGLVEVRGGSGVYVRAAATPPMRDGTDAPGPFDVLEARLLVEPDCAALAARSTDAPARLAVAEAFGRMRAEAVAGCVGDLADRDFHLAIAEASGNPVLSRIVGDLWRDQAAPVASRLTRLAVSPLRRRQNLGEHAQIAEAIAAGAAAAARAAMRRHLLAVRRARMAALGG